MLTTRSNIHRSRLPAPGAIVIVTMRQPLPGPSRHRKFIAESYNLCDGALYRRRHLSLGIHLVHLRALDNGERVTMAGHWCEELAS